MYCAHMDEVGFMIRHICEDGKLLFEAVGIQPEVLPSKRLSVAEHIPGVICSKPVHLMKGENHTPQIEDMYIDIGCQNRAEAQALGVYASFAVFENRYTKFGAGSLVRSKALDDRFGCFVLTAILKNDLHYDSYFAFTVGEELGGTGAIAATREVKPGTALIFESTTASDLPSNTGADRVCVPGTLALLFRSWTAVRYMTVLYMKRSAHLPPPTAFQRRQKRALLAEPTQRPFNAVFPERVWQPFPCRAAIFILVLA